jgi:hypothetical protein
MRDLDLGLEGLLELEKITTVEKSRPRIQKSFLDYCNKTRNSMGRDLDLKL